MNALLSSILATTLSAGLHAQKTSAADPLRDIVFPKTTVKNKLPIQGHFDGRIPDSFDGSFWWIGGRSRAHKTPSHIKIYIGDFPNQVGSQRKDWFFTDFLHTSVVVKGVEGMPAGKSLGTYCQWGQSHIAKDNWQSTYCIVYDDLCLIHVSVLGKRQDHPEFEVNVLARKMFSEVHRIFRVTGSGENRRVVLR